MDYIAGRKTAGDWAVLKAILVASPSEDAWRQAFNDFFVARLRLRYLEPIQVLQEHGRFVGEGFSIAAIQCSLIEFLESTVQGLNYRWVPRGDKLGPFEYSGSRSLFERFLTVREPFASHFTDDLAQDFYVGVRCALLHEARTKHGWRIWAKDPKEVGRPIDADQKVVFRDDFQAALLHFIESYGRELLRNREYQAAFIRKFDEICVG